jgi:hypothetical protein
LNSRSAPPSTSSEEAGGLGCEPETFQASRAWFDRFASFVTAANAPAKEPVKEPVKERAEERSKEPADETIGEPAREPVKEAVRRPIRQPAKERAVEGDTTMLSPEGRPASKDEAIHFDDALEVLIKYLAALPQTTTKDHGGDLWIPHVVQGYWQLQPDPVGGDDLEDRHYQPFYDAAWELSRIGVLRPGEFAPRGWATDAGLFSGDTFSITRFGRTWLKDATQRPIADPGRLSHALQEFGARFGGGYAQRATEAVRTHRASNYLAACVMAGAAAEAILLSLATAKMGDPAKVLVEYNATGGRRRVIKRMGSNAAPALGVQLEGLLAPFVHWHDSAGFATMTSVSEIEARNALTDLLRLAQFVKEHWDELSA